MSQTADLFSYTPPYEPPYARTSETSREAAESIKPSLGRLQEAIFMFIRDAGEHGATADEIHRETLLAGNTIRPRLLELIESGKIEKTDVKRKTQSGRNAFVYRARREA